MARRPWSVHRVRNLMINEMSTPGLAKKTGNTPCCEVLPVEVTASALSGPTRSTAKMSATTMRRRDVVIACDPISRDTR